MNIMSKVHLFRFLEYRSIVKISFPCYTKHVPTYNVHERFISVIFATFSTFTLIRISGKQMFCFRI